MPRTAPSVRSAPPVSDLRWGVVWRSANRADGQRCHLLGDGLGVRTFATKRDAAAYISQQYGYIAKRADLRREPHGWFLPVAVRVRVRVEVV